jgi:hypothetical protein
MTRSVLCVVAFGWLNALSPAHAHFLWVVVPADDKDSSQAEMYFSESAEPGEAHLIDRLAPARLWRVAADGKGLEIKSAQDVRGEVAARVARLDGERPAAVEARWQYGVRSRGQQSFLLEYYARHVVDAGRVEKTVFRDDRLALELRPTITEWEIVLVALWKGRPAAGCEIIAYDGEGDEHAGKTDAEGRFRTKRKKPGLHSLRVLLVENDRRGELGGKKYDSVRHYSTLTFRLPAADSGKSGEPNKNDKNAAASAHDAARLLAAARANRSSWEKFPGFRATIAVHEDHQSQRGRISCSADGKVTLELSGTIGKKWAQSQLDQLVRHRMPAGDVGEAATFCDEPPGHPLGRLIRLDDAAMGSRYRIACNRITEVHRTTGHRQFTISVLAFHMTPDDKYLPAVYSIVTWNKEESNQLESTRDVINQWRRVGSFELPERIVEVESRSDGRRVRSIELSEHALMTREQ